jgi:hypothetical protein
MEHKNDHTLHVTLEIQTLPWDIYKFVAGINPLMESQSSHFDNWISNDNT